MVLEFRAENDRVKGWRGLACVALIVAVICLDSLLSVLLESLFGDLVSTIAFWVIGGLVALWTLRYFVMGYSYVLSGTVLRISHLYSRYERAMETIYTSTIVSAGEPEEVLGRHKDARVVRALLSRCPVPPYAVAFKREGVITVYLVQVDEKMRARLAEIAKENRK